MLRPTELKMLGPRQDGNPGEGLAIEEENSFPMDTQHLSAPVSGAGVIHANVTHTANFTVVGNHLAQHEHLSLTAMGLALHIQSLPAGSRVGVKHFAARFPEGEIRVAAALRELEAHGYLSRTRERLPSGRIVTRTVSYNNPGATEPPEPDGDPDPDKAPVPDPDKAPVPDPGQAPDAVPSPRQESAPVRGETPALPQNPAVELLLGLRSHDARFLLSERDVRHLAPGVDAWFARGATPDAVRRTLLADLPEPLKHPAGLLSHRLKALLPPPLPAVPPVQGPPPIQTCVTCEEVAFRAWEPGRCPDCEADADAAAVAA
ncbi:helix-turn-helix domain-containing protein [Streptomyces sp. NRRL B-24572]|uniref:helix-turn-helix domain-containing protein n=1 Tax=Streptomyces sp. NRRL B-24572 TaxID=1962156 RepID=UPI00277D0A03|nr:helix-turn-helix domain-containing protein [Streptomyces sp. NRRL B-24572]